MRGKANFSLRCLNCGEVNKKILKLPHQLGVYI